MPTILLGNDFNQLEFIIEFKDGKSFSNTEFNKLSLTVSGGDSQKEHHLLPKRAFPIFGKKRYFYKNKDLKNIQAKSNQSENLFFTFSYIDKDFVYKDIVVKFETGWLQDGNLYQRKNKNKWGRINNSKNCELVKKENGRSRIKIIFNKQNTHIDFKVVDIKNTVIENAHIEFIKPFNMINYLSKDKDITFPNGKVDFNGTYKKTESELKEIPATVLITKEGFLPKWLDINVKLGINNEKTHVVRLLKRNKAKLDDDYCYSLGMELKNGCNECSCKFEDDIYYSELKKCDKKCMENEFPEMITNENDDKYVNCIEKPADVIQESDIISVDQKRMSIEIEFGNHKPEKMDLYILEEIYDDNKFLDELGSFEGNRIGEIELINKKENSNNKIGILNVIEDYRFEDEVCEGMRSDSSDLNFIKYNSSNSPYYDISRRRGLECEYFYDFDATIFNNYLITFYFLTDNEELYKYTLHAHAVDELHEFRDINDLNLVFIINNRNQIELKNKDDFKVQKTASVLQDNDSYRYKAKECDDNCCELINTLSLNLEECDWEASYVLSEALFFDCIDEIEFEISSLKLIIKSLYKYLTNMNDNELIIEMTGINNKGHTSSSSADPNFFIEPQAVSLLMMYFKHSLYIMKERNEDFGLCDKAEIYFLKAEFYYLIAQLLLVKEKGFDDWEFKIEQIDFIKNKRIDEEITIQSIKPEYTIPIKNIYFYIGDKEHVYEIVVHENNNKFDNKNNISSITFPRFSKEASGIGEKLNSRSAAKIAKDTYLQYEILSGDAMTIEGCNPESTYSQINELKIILK